MSDENKELLARIGQLAGQINRHKTQQAGRRAPPNLHPSHHHSNTYRPTRPYSNPSYRIGRQGGLHRHRTLQLNGTGTPPTSAGEGDSSAESSGWVSKTDRHRQLINADVYAKKSQERARAIEETRKNKVKTQRRGEKARLNDFIKSQARNSHVSATTSSIGGHEIMVEGLRFRVLDGGKKLVKVPSEVNLGLTTPRTVTIAGIKFHRTKSGNLVASRIVKTQRRSGVVKLDQLCKIFSMTGSCPKGPQCRYIHDPSKVAVCRDFLKDGKCVNGESCDLSHDLTPQRVPDCLHYAKGNCSKADCPYTHSSASPGAPVCTAFGFNGYCPKGAACADRHVFECPDFSNHGRCKNKGCKLPHRERASVLRNQSKDGEPEEDVSSDEEAADSDDVDSDAIAEFLEADSDDSDFENSKDFIPL